jgi:triphosphoribosyl-dephospho-CoA synthase
MRPDFSPLGPGALAQFACLLEATARKPGNVHRFRDFDDVHYLDFVLSASAIAGPMDQAPASSLGATILGSVEATRRLVASNTNLGMILLLAPLASVPGGEDLRQGVGRILEQTTVDDASLAYRAIRLAAPGGLGEADDQDVADEPTLTLREAMALAAGRDLVARQYANGFADVFNQALPGLEAGLSRGWPVETAIVGAFLAALAARPDTLIARKRGEPTAIEASRRASNVLGLGWPEARQGRQALDDLDAWLRQDGHARNPGATADLITAALFAALRNGTIELPLAGPWSSFSKDSGLRTEDRVVGL